MPSFAPSPPVHRVVGARRRRRIVVAVCSTVVALTATPVAHASFVGSGTDPAGDAPAAGLDIAEATFGYDRRSGQMAAAVRLRAVPTDDATVVAYAGTRTPTGCDRAPAFGFAGTVTSRRAQWIRLDGANAVVASGYAANEGYASSTMKFSVDDAKLRGLRPDCVQVGVTSADGSVHHDTLVLDLKPFAGLAVDLSGLPKTVDVNRRRTLKVTVSNPGDARTSRVRVRIGALRGMTPSRRTVTVPSIGPGKRRTVRVGIAFNRRARTVNDVKVRATAGLLNVEAERRVNVRMPSKKRSGGGGGGGTPSVCTQYIPDFSGESGGSLGLVPCLR